MTKDVKENQTRQQNLTLITGRVLRGLGRPPDLQRVQVRHLWEVTASDFPASTSSPHGCTAIFC